MYGIFLWEKYKGLTCYCLPGWIVASPAAITQPYPSSFALPVQRSYSSGISPDLIKLIPMYDITSKYIVNLLKQCSDVLSFIQNYYIKF